MLLLSIAGGVGVWLFMGRGDEDANARPVDVKAAQSGDTAAGRVAADVLNGSQRPRTVQPTVMTFDGSGEVSVDAIVSNASMKPADAIPAPKPVAVVPKPTPVQTPNALESTRVGSGSPYDAGVALLRQQKLVEGRAALSALLTDRNTRLSAQDQQVVRDMLAQVNKDLIFSPRIVPGDPLVEQYVIGNGDLLSTVAPKYNTTYKFIATINNIPNPDRIRLGQKVKIVKGPFHAVISKKAYRMDLFLPDANGKMIYIRSYPVGLGENDSTPIGSWILTKGGKVENPTWTDPRTGKFVAANSPDNPLGGYWIRLEGTDDNTRTREGYGIHGTDEQQSVGQQQSLGCIRMRDGDIQEVFHMLIDGKSTVYVGE